MYNIRTRIWRSVYKTKIQTFFFLRKFIICRDFSTILFFFLLLFLTIYILYTNKRGKNGTISLKNNELKEE